MQHADIAEDIEMLLEFLVAQRPREHLFREFPAYATYTLASKALFACKKNKERVRALYDL
jgi:hypothetical protein